MKARLTPLIIILSIILVIPLCIITFFITPTEPNHTPPDTFIIKDELSGEITTFSDKEFLFGAVAAQMPISFHEEALKAQTIAEYTLFYKKKELSTTEFDFSCDLSQIYKDKQQLKTSWKNKFNQYSKKLRSVIDSVYKTVITQDNKLITSVFHAISSGYTETSLDIFGEQNNYLVTVASPGDCFAPGYQTTATFSEKDFREKVNAYWKNVTLNDSPESWIQNINRTSVGSILNMKIGDKTVTGTEVKDCFNLRSSNFTITYKDNSFIFTITGYGHGVGMSQYGAEYMASQGSNYIDILTHYYPNTEITQLN